MVRSEFSAPFLGSLHGKSPGEWVPKTPNAPQFIEAEHSGVSLASTEDDRPAFGQDWRSRHRQMRQLGIKRSQPQPSWTCLATRSLEEHLTPRVDRQAWRAAGDAGRQARLPARLALLWQDDHPMTASRSSRRGLKL